LHRTPPRSLEVRERGGGIAYGLAATIGQCCQGVAKEITFGIRSGHATVLLDFVFYAKTTYLD
jgi:hypothetical protein